MARKEILMSVRSNPVCTWWKYTKTTLLNELSWWLNNAILPGFTIRLKKVAYDPREGARLPTIKINTAGREAYSLPAAMRRCCMQERVARLSKLLCCIWQHPYCSRQLAAEDRRFLVFCLDNGIRLSGSSQSSVFHVK